MTEMPQVAELAVVRAKRAVLVTAATHEPVNRWSSGTVSRFARATIHRQHGRSLPPITEIPVDPDWVKPPRSL
jgi:hypothetical protein